MTRALRFTCIVLLVGAASCTEKPSTLEVPPRSAAVSKLCLGADRALSVMCIRRLRGADRLMGIQAAGAYAPSQFTSPPARDVGGGIFELASDDSYRGTSFAATPETSAPISNGFAASNGQIVGDSATLSLDVFNEADVYDPYGWEYWDDYPYSPEGTPLSSTHTRVLWTSADPPISVTLRSSRPLTVLGFELSGFSTASANYAPGGSMNVAYYRDSVLMHTRTVTADQWNDVVFVGTEIRGGFNRVVISGDNYLVSLGNVRFRPAPSLSVTCSPKSVLRGNEIRCEMSLTDGGSLTVPSWRFESTAPLDPTTPEPSLTGSSVWSGPLVISGKVWGAAMLNGRRDSASVDVRADPRPWFASGVRMPRTVPTYVGQGSLPAQPVYMKDLGAAAMKVGFDPQLCTSNPLCTSITQGPNQGLYYYSAQPLVFTRWAVEINVTATTPGSLWWNSFPVHPTGTTCTRAQLAPLRALIEAHEGTQPDNQPNSHTRVFRDFVDSLGITMIETAVWGATPFPSTIVDQINARAVAHSGVQIDSTGRNPLALPCNLGLKANP